MAVLVSWTAFRGVSAKGLAEKKKQLCTPFLSQTTIRPFPLQVDCLGTHTSGSEGAQVVRCGCVTVESWSVRILIEVVWSGLQLYISSQHPTSTHLAGPHLPFHQWGFLVSEPVAALQLETQWLCLWLPLQSGSGLFTY